MGDRKLDYAVWRGCRQGVVQIPIDELDRYYTPPFDIVLTPDKSTAYVSTTGSDSVTVIDVGQLLAFVKNLSPGQRRTVANDLSVSANYVSGRVPVGHGPKGMVLSPDGRRLYVANRTGDANLDHRHRVAARGSCHSVGRPR